MQTRRSQEPVPRKGCEGASPSRRTESERARCPASLLTSARSGVPFESAALLAWKVDREVKCPAGNGWPGSPAHVRSVYLPPRRGNPIGDGTGSENRRASALRVRFSPSLLMEAQAD
jgi:hypothetical protein